MPYPLPLTSLSPMRVDAPTSAAQFPNVVPTLVDPGRGVTLRAHHAGDLAAIVEQCRDPDSIRWTTVPVPPGGYAAAHAEEWLGLVAAGWAAGSPLTCAIETGVDGFPRYCGSIDLRLSGEVAEVGFGLHPAARGRSVMSTALRLVRDYGFDVLGLPVLRWRAQVGNWGSRRVAAAAGFRFDGAVRRLLPHRGQLCDGWIATLTAEDPRTPLHWLEPPVLTGTKTILRPFTDADAPRIAAACAEERTRFWLVSLPQPYGLPEASGYVEATRELAASGRGLVWCVADPVDDRCLGSVSVEGFGGYARRLEIGYWAHPDARGQGVITNAVRRVTEHLETSRLVDSIMIRAAASNCASRHVAEAAGYRVVGTLSACEPLGNGSLADLVVYARPYPTSPAVASDRLRW